MTTEQMHEVMQVSRNYLQANKAAKALSNALSEVRAEASYFLSPEQIKILRQADTVADELREITNEWEAAKYAANLLSQTTL